MCRCSRSTISSPTSLFFFSNNTATTEIYTLSLHDALPISGTLYAKHVVLVNQAFPQPYTGFTGAHKDRKSTRLNSSHVEISYAVFCLKKKKQKKRDKCDRHEGSRSTGAANRNV